MALRRTILSVFLVLFLTVAVSGSAHTSLHDLWISPQAAGRATGALSADFGNRNPATQAMASGDLMAPEPGTMLLLGTGLLGLVATFLRHQPR